MGQEAEQEWYVGLEKHKQAPYFWQPLGLP